MELHFHDPSYDRLEIDRSYFHDLPAPVVTLYRKRLQLLRAARDIGDLTAMRCLRLRNLESHSSQVFSVHLDRLHGLIIELREQSNRPELWIVEIREGQT